MSGFPEDIMKAAEAVRAAVNDCSNHDRQAEFIAAALFAERERCNGIVLVASCVESGDVRHVLDNVSEAIMKGGAA